MKSAIVIGAGIGGVASAIRLAAKGFSVRVYEANSAAGGKLSQIETEEYRFDAGPSLFTMPQYVDELFELAGKNPRDYFNYQKLDVLCRYFFDDGTKLTAWSDIERFAEEVESKTSDNAVSILDFLRKSATIYSITNHVFLEKSLHKLSTYFDRGTLRSLLRLPQIDAGRSMSKANQTFFKDSRTVQLFNRYATYNGSNPYRAPATLNVIPHLEYNFGAFLPYGGMYSITSSLVQLALDCGVQFFYNTPVEKIVLKNKGVEGVIANGKLESAEVVVSNMDAWFTYRKLLPEFPAPERTLRQERSSSALIFYWGIRGTFSQLDVHNIFFSRNYQEEFETIWKRKAVPEDPTIYINITSKKESKDAPAGCENWFVMINVPSNTGQDWETLISKARADILKKLGAVFKTDLSSLIQTERVLDPRDIESKTSSYQGSLYGTSSNSALAAFLRHPNFTSEVKGLYFVGGSVHPGGGIPLALLSAKIVADLVK